MERQGLNEDLQKLESLIDELDWFTSNDHEPKVGDTECPELAEKYGTRGQSLFTAFVTKQGGDGVYGCAYAPCSAYSTNNLEEAIRHIRSHHFNHSPFPCVPLNGDEWYVSLCSLPYSFPCTRRRLTWFPRIAIVASLPSLT